MTARWRWVLVGIVAALMIEAAVMCRYSLAPIGGGLGAFRLDRWTGKVSVVTFDGLKELPEQKPPVALSREHDLFESLGPPRQTAAPATTR